MSMLAWPNSTTGTIPRSICSDSCPNGYIRNFQVTLLGWEGGGKRIVCIHRINKSSRKGEKKKKTLLLLQESGNAVGL